MINCYYYYSFFIDDAYDVLYSWGPTDPKKLGEIDIEYYSKMRNTEEWNSNLKFEAGSAVEQLCLAITVTRLNCACELSELVSLRATHSPSGSARS